MSTPISFTIRPPGAASASAPAKPSPLGRHSSSHRGPPSRRHFEQAGDENDDEDEDGLPQQRVEKKRETAFSGFGNGGEETSKPKKDAPMVIPSLPNKDWRQSSQARNRPSYVPETKPKQEVSDPNLDRINDGPQRRGLRILSPSKEEPQVKIEPGVAVYDEVSVKYEENEKPKVEQQLSLDQQALEALLSGSPPPQESDAERMQREMVIQMSRDREMDRVGGNLETDAFRQDLASRPSESTLDDYAVVPIAAFGAAMLRGMGHDPSKDTAIHIPKARPALLGIGATPRQTAGPPEGSASGKNKKNARPPKQDYAKRGGRGYMPLVQREKSSTPLAITGGTTSGEVSRRTSPGTNGTGSETDGSARRRRRDLDDVDGTDGSERERGSSRRRDERDGDSDRRRDERSRRDRDDREGSRRDDRDRDRVRSSRDDRDREHSGRDERDGRRRDDRDCDRDRGRDDGDRYKRDTDRDRDRDRR